VSESYAHTQAVKTLLDAQITTPIQQLQSQAVRRDDDVDPPLFYAIDVWRYRATPA